MVNRKAIHALTDILEIIEEVEGYVATHSLGTYREDMMLRRCIERCLEIISEASRRIPDNLKAKHPEIPWPEIKGLGNIIRHEYGAVDEEVVWRTATRSLPELKPVIQALLQDAKR